MDHVRRVSSDQEFDRTVDEFLTRGYEIAERGEGYITLRRRDWGEAEIHLIILALTLWWTFGLANVLYGIYSHVNADEITILNESKQDGIPSDGPTDAIEARDNHQNQGKAPSINKIEGAGEAYEGESRLSSDSRFPIIIQFGLQLFSITVASIVFIVILTVFIDGFVGELVGVTLVALFTAVLFRYTAVYHRFSKARYHFLCTGISLCLSILGIALVLERLSERMDLTDFSSLLTHLSGLLEFEWLLPERFAVLILTGGGLLILIGMIYRWDYIPYPKPTSIRDIALSPVAFGFVASIIGLWAVLFVGFSLQRIVVIAPIFEELLKGGVALLVGSVLFGRSRTSRIGTAIIVGAIFGIVEHATTYPFEQNFYYQFRILFHMSTTVLTVSVYSAFESTNARDCLELAPIFSMLIHFFNNTFAILGGLTLGIIGGIPPETASFVYGIGGVGLISVLVVISLIRQKFLLRLHLPFRDVLAHLV